MADLVSYIWGFIGGYAVFWAVFYTKELWNRILIGNLLSKMSHNERLDCLSSYMYDNAPYYKLSTKQQQRVLRRLKKYE